MMTKIENDIHDTVYALPPEVAVALNTGRQQFILMLINQIEQGRALPPEQIIEVLRLCAHMFEDRQHLRHKLQEFSNLVELMDGLGKGLLKKVLELYQCVNDMHETLLGKPITRSPLTPNDD